MLFFIRRLFAWFSGLIKFPLMKQNTSSSLSCSRKHNSMMSITYSYESKRNQQQQCHRRASPLVSSYLSRSRKKHEGEESEKGIKVLQDDILYFWCLIYESLASLVYKSLLGLSLGGVRMCFIRIRMKYL